MPTMPNVVGLGLYDAQASLQTAGVLVPSSLGYFTAWPITLTWINGVPFEWVTAQSPSSGSTVAANSSVTLTVNNPKLSVAYP